MTIENVLDKYEYSKKDLIGHGAFAVVFKGKSDQVKWGPSSLVILKGTFTVIQWFFRKNILITLIKIKIFIFFNRNESC